METRAQTQKRLETELAASRDENSRLRDALASKDREISLLRERLSAASANDAKVGFPAPFKDSTNKEQLESTDTENAQSLSLKDDELEKLRSANAECKKEINVLRNVLEQLKQELVCPISQDTPNDPVILVESGTTYDCENLCRWLLERPNVVPDTGIKCEKPLAFVRNHFAVHALTLLNGTSSLQRYDDSQFQLQYRVTWEKFQYPERFLVTALASAESEDEATRALEDFLEAVLEDPDQHRGNLTQSGSLQAVCSIMRAHPNSADIQRLGCEALFVIFTLCENDYDFYVAWAELIEDLHGIDLILSAMRRHPLSSDVQHEACRVLNLASGYCHHGAELIIKLGGINLILTAMRTHPDSRNALAHACKIFASLAFLSSIESDAVEVINAIVTVMKAHPDSAQIQTEGCKALKNLSCDNCNNIKLIIDLNGINLIAKAMEMHPESVDVQESACCAFEEILECEGDDDMNITLLIKEAGLVELFQKLYANKDFGGVSAFRLEYLKSCCRQ